MNNEKMRVTARMMLVGKTHTGNLLSLFSVLLRVSVYALAAVAVIRFNPFTLNLAGWVLFTLCTFAVLSGILLLQCVRTVKDRWYFSLCEDNTVSVTQLIASFTARDFLASLKLGFLSFVYTLSRLIMFFAFPVAFAALSVVALRDGVSAPVLAVLLTGDLILFSCGALFSFTLINCVSLARSLSCDVINGYVSRLKVLEGLSFRLVRFGATLSVFNRSHRRLSKLVFIRSLPEIKSSFTEEKLILNL